MGLAGSRGSGGTKVGGRGRGHGAGGKQVAGPEAVGRRAVAMALMSPMRTRAWKLLLSV